MRSKVIFILLLFLGETILAADYYCDPVNGNIHHDGSKDFPWSKLEEVFNSGKTFKAGDVIYLLEGYHGNVSVEGINTDFVYIRNYLNSSPRLSRLSFGASSPTSKWEVDGLIIGAEYNSSYHKNSLLFTGKKASYIKIKNTIIYTKEDITGWTKTDWNNNVSPGVIFKGTFCSIEGSTVKNIRTGIQFEGSDCSAINNKIMNFAGDGMRGLADKVIFEYNLIQDNYVIDNNHDDGFQAWTSEGGLVEKGLVKAHITRFALDEVEEAFRLLKAGKIHGRAVIIP